MKTTNIKIELDGYGFYRIKNSPDPDFNEGGICASGLNRDFPKRACFGSRTFRTAKRFFPGATRIRVSEFGIEIGGGFRSPLPRLKRLLTFLATKGGNVWVKEITRS